MANNGLKGILARLSDNIPHDSRIMKDYDSVRMPRGELESELRGKGPIFVIVDTENFVNLEGRMVNIDDARGFFMNESGEAFYDSQPHIEMTEQFYLSVLVSGPGRTTILRSDDAFVRMVKSATFTGRIVQDAQGKPKREVADYRIRPQDPLWEHKVNSAIKGRLEAIRDASLHTPALSQGPPRKR